jgi:hypothetical protein
LGFTNSPGRAAQGFRTVTIECSNRSSFAQIAVQSGTFHVRAVVLHKKCARYKTRCRVPG